MTYVRNPDFLKRTTSFLLAFVLALGLVFNLATSAEAASVSYYKTTKANTPVYKSSSRFSKKVATISTKGTIVIVTATKYGYCKTDNGWISNDNLRKITAYSVTYDANGGSGAPKTQYFEEKTSVQISSTVPTHSDYIFAGWSTSKDDTKASISAGSGICFSESVTLYAVWKLDGTYAKGTSIPVVLSSTTNCLKGTIRYVSQNKKAEYYSKEYWTSVTSGTVYNSSDKCSTAALSMCLSYLGINALPRDIRDANNSNFYYQLTKYTDYFVEKGIITTSSQLSVVNYETGYSNLTTMLNDFESNSNYSPVMLQMYNDSAGVSHFIVVIADLGDGKYQTVDSGTSAGVSTLNINTNTMKTTYKGYSCNVRFCQYILND